MLAMHPALQERQPDCRRLRIQLMYLDLTAVTMA
jgi:hypothetical protein